MRWAGHVARLGERRTSYWGWWGNLTDRDHFEDLGVHAMIIIKWFTKK
jgi:hypothetical protein